MYSKGFEVLATLPDWYQYLLYIAISASFGIKGVGQARKMIRKKMINWLLQLFKKHSGDLSKHRLHTTKYEDLCM